MVDLKDMPLFPAPQVPWIKLKKSQKDNQMARVPKSNGRVWPAV